MRSSVILDEHRLREVVSYFRTQPAFAFDVESQGEHRGVCHLNDVTWMSMATDGACVVIPFGHPIGTKIIGSHKERLQYGGDGPKAGTYYNKTIYDFEPAPKQIPRATVFEMLEPLFFSTATKSAHGAVFDIASTAKYWGEVMPPPYNDTVIQSWLLDENRNRHGLKYITKDTYGFQYDDEEVGRCVESHPFGKVAHYSYCDAMYAWLFYKRFTPLIEAEGLSKVYHLEMDVLNVLVGMRLAGSHVDVQRLKELKVELTEKRALVQEELMDRAGQDFNPNSPQQKQKILFGPKSEGGQELKPWKLTDTAKKKRKDKKYKPPSEGHPDWVKQWSTDDEALESYPGNPVASTLREYQEVNKLLSTYVLAYLGNPEKDKPTQIYGDRIYAEFVQYGTTTRRFSCRDPNLQNIPRPSTELGKLIRGVWDTEPGWSLVVGDYGQIELVVFAHFAGKGALFEGFWEGADPHQLTADKVGIERQLAKTLNFSMSYGAGMYKVSSMLGVDIQTGKSILEDHQREFPEIYALKDQIIETCAARKPHYLRTLLGGKRRLPMINSAKGDLRSRAERQAVSSVIQGSAADLIKMAMVRADTLLGEQCPDAHLILSIHDEIVIYAPTDQAEKAAKLLEQAMCGPEIQSLISVPLTADIKIVSRWSEAK